jgi:hypothetical protein
VEEREFPVQVKGFGAPPTTAVVNIAVLSGADRLKRAGVTLGAAFAVALIALPIPIVHFMLVPGSLLTGLILAGNRLTVSEIFRHAEGPCPFCGTEQAFPVMGRFRLPKRAHCMHCGRNLSLEDQAAPKS